MYEFLGSNGSQFSGGNILSLQNAILENRCTLPAYGADGRWGSETEAGVRCLIGRRGQEFVLSSWPWVVQRMAISQAQAPTTQTSQQGQEPVPWWFSWAAAAIAFVSIVAVGSILTSRAEKSAVLRRRY